MTTDTTSPEGTQPDWRLVEPPPELWPLVVASTIGRTRLRRQVIRSLRVPLTIAAIVLVIVSSATTVWVMKRLSPRAQAGVQASPAKAAIGAGKLHPGSAPAAPRKPIAPTAPRPRS